MTNCPSTLLKTLLRASYAMVLALLLASCASGKSGLNNYGCVEYGDKGICSVGRVAQPTPDGFKTLAKMGFRTAIVLNGSDTSDAVNAGLLPISYPLEESDMPPLSVLERIADTIADKAIWPVITYCTRGADRTGVVILLYRVRADKWDYGSAEQEMMKFIPEGREWWPDILERMHEIKEKYK